MSVTCSAALIVKNEEASLARCLQALRGAVGEIVVVDTGSEDRTVEIARGFADAVYSFTWCDDFAAARNFAIERASGDYVLSVDADEHLLDAEQAAGLIEAFVHRYPSEVIGTVDIISAVGAGRDAQEVRSVLQRFFRRDRYRFEGAIHEQLAALDGVKRAAMTGLRFSHSGYALDPSSPENKSHRNKRLLKAALTQYPDDEYYWFQLGKAHVALGEHGDACSAFMRALACIRFDGKAAWGRTGAVAPEVLTDLVVSLVYACVNAGRLDAAVALLNTHASLGHAGVNTPDFHHAAGYVHLMAGDVARSRVAYETSLEFDPRREQVLGTASFGSLYHLGLLHEAEKNLDAACTYYREALRSKPDYGPAMDRCIDLVLEQQTLAPNDVWAACAPAALAERCEARLYQLLQEGRGEQAAVLMQAAKAISPGLFETCTTFLRRLEREPESETGRGA